MTDIVERLILFLRRLIPGWRRRAWAQIEKEERARARLLGIRSEFDKHERALEPKP